ncbi:MAG TPA: integrase core domain-containing protein, partial [Vicinamibacterales bacterium]|nr:integrase core domain-containing protein [Vicinamibacterales bacterium]
ERFVRSIKEECLDRIIPIGERHFRRAVAEYVAHYHHERNHQGLRNEPYRLRDWTSDRRTDSPPPAAWRSPQLLRAGGVMQLDDHSDGTAEGRDITGGHASRASGDLVPPSTLQHRRRSLECVGCLRCRGFLSSLGALASR